MRRAYLRTDPDRYDRLIAKGYSDAAIAASDGLLCKAESQDPRGRFTNELVLRGHLHKRHWHCLPFLFAQGDLVKAADGSIYIDGWDEWQEGNWQVAERMKRVRARRLERNGRYGGDRNIGDGGDRNDGDASHRNGSDGPHRNGLVNSGSGSGSGKPLAVAHPPTPLVLPDQVRGSTEDGQETVDEETTAKAQAIAEWFTSMTGPLHLSGRTRAHEAAVALGQARLPMELSAMLALMQRLYVEAPDDNKPHSLNYFSAALEIAANEALKVAPPATSRGFGFQRAFEEGTA